MEQGLESDFKSVEDCEEALENMGFQQCELVELHCIIKAVIDEVLDDLFNQNT